MLQRPLRVGIISAAWGVQAHLPAWRSVDGIEVVAICTSRRETAEAAARDHGFARCFWDYRAMAEDPDIDLIDCGTRPTLRYDMVKTAFAAGKHVYQGIPFAHNLAAARELNELHRKSGKVAAVDAFIQTAPAMVYMKELIEQGEIGDIQGFNITFNIGLFTEARTYTPGYTWFADPANGASAMRNIGSHSLHLLVHLLGPVSEIVSDQSLRLSEWKSEDGPGIKPEVPDTSYNIIRLRNGVSGMLQTVWTMVDGPGFRIDVWGTKGRLAATSTIFPQSYSCKLYRGDDVAFMVLDEHEVNVPERFKTLPGISIHADEPRMGVFSMASIYASMLREMEGKGRAAPDFEQALHVQEVVEAAAISSAERRWVTIGS
jgi:predicted dehydrogenase